MRWPLERALRRVGAAFALLACLLLPATVAAGQDPRKVVETSQAAIGRDIGDFAFTDSTGREVRLSDFRGRPLLVSFIYTGCFQACPVATQFLLEAVKSARKALGDDRFQVVSIGFNQPFDSPPAMAAFAKQNGIDDPRWRFLTPRAGEIEAITQRFGFVYEATAAGFDHVTQVTVVDAEGRVYRQVYGDQFDLQMLVQPLKELLSGQASKSFTVENVWEKVKLYCTVYDPNAGRYKFNYGIFVEIFAGLTTLGAISADHATVRAPRERRPPDSDDPDCIRPHQPRRGRPARQRAARTRCAIERGFDAVCGEADNPLRQLGALGFQLFWLVSITGGYLYVFYDTSLSGAWSSIEALTVEQWWRWRDAQPAPLRVGCVRARGRGARREGVRLGRFRHFRWYTWLTGVPTLWLLRPPG